MRFNPTTQRLEDETAKPVPDPLATWTPYRPPWYPYEDDPWTILSSMSGNIITRYDAWKMTLAPGELKRLIANHLASRPGTR